MIKLSVSVVVYRSDLNVLRATIQHLLEAVRRARQQLSQRIWVEFCLVHNDAHLVESTLDIDHILSQGEIEVFDRFEQLKANKNLGYGGGHNLVIKQIDSDYHLILNPDVYLDKDALVIALQYLDKKPAVALVTPFGVNGQGTREYLCKRYPSVFVLYLRGFAPRFLRKLFVSHIYRYEMREIYENEEICEDIEIASGCCMLIRTSTLQALEGFSSQYFLYFEDFDLSMRLRQQARLAYLPDMRILHHGGYSVRKGLWHILLFCRSGYKFFNQYGWRWK